MQHTLDVLAEALAAAFERGNKIDEVTAATLSSDERKALALTDNFAVMCVHGYPTSSDLDLLLKHTGIARQPIMIASDINEEFFIRASSIRVRCYLIEVKSKKERDIGSVVFYHPPKGIFCMISSLKVGLLQLPGVRDALKEILEADGYDRMLIRFHGEAPVDFGIGIGRRSKAGAVGKLPRREVVVMPPGALLMLDVPVIPPLPLYEVHLDVKQMDTKECTFRPDAMTHCILLAVSGLERPIEFNAASMFRPALRPGKETQLCTICWRRCGEEQRTYVSLKRPFTSPATLPIVPPPTEGFMVCCLYCANALASADQDQLNNSVLALAKSHDDDRDVLVSMGAYMMQLHRFAVQNFDRILGVGDVPGRYRSIS